MTVCNTPIGFVHSFESFGAVDGPGIRFIVFLSGCNMRCAYCHNADTWKAGTGTQMTADEVLKKALRFKAYWGKEGGITVSGGEAMLQLDFVTDLFEKAKRQGVHTTLDTAGQPFTFDEPQFSKINRLLAVTDLLLLDIKHIDDSKHKKLTGKSNQNILQFATYLSEIGKPVWIRHVLVPTVTDEDASLYKLRDFIDTLSNVKRVEVLPYHTMGAYKWDEQGYNYPLKGISPPTAERVENAKKILRCEENAK